MGHMSLNKTIKNTYDAIVIGSGISGGYAAMELCTKGYKTLVLERGTKFTSIVDGVSYTFSSLESQTAIRDDRIIDEVTYKTFTYEAIPIAEGTIRWLSYRVDNDIENQKFQISDADADTSALRVRVQNNQQSESFDSYQLFSSLQDVVSDTLVYHLQENSSGFYQIFFGDGIIGKKPVVIYFYPKDNTPGCTMQACGFRDSYEDFIDLGAEVIGVSSDTVNSHKKFTSQYKLPFTLLSDSDKKLRKLFGVPDKLFGLLPGRVTYIINKKGIITIIAIIGKLSIL